MNTKHFKLTSLSLIICLTLFTSCKDTQNKEYAASAKLETVRDLLEHDGWKFIGQATFDVYYHDNNIPWILHNGIINDIYVKDEGSHKIYAHTTRDRDKCRLSKCPDDQKKSSYWLHYLEIGNFVISAPYGDPYNPSITTIYNARDNSNRYGGYANINLSN